MKTELGNFEMLVLMAVLRLDEDDAEVRRNLGVLLTRMRRLDEAIEVLRESVLLAPGRAVSQYALAYALDEDGRRDEAEEAYRETLRLEPGHSGARTKLAETAAGGAGG